MPALQQGSEAGWSCSGSGMSSEFRRSVGLLWASRRTTRSTRTGLEVLQSLGGWAESHTQLLRATLPPWHGDLPPMPRRPRFSPASILCYLLLSSALFRLRDGNRKPAS